MKGTALLLPLPLPLAVAVALAPAEPPAAVADDEDDEDGAENALYQPGASGPLPFMVEMDASNLAL